MGEVYRARDTRLGREVALKVISDGAALNPERLQRFEQEARLAGSLNHPNLVVVHDVGSEGGAPFLVTELLEENRCGIAFPGVGCRCGPRARTRSANRGGPGGGSRAWRRPPGRETGEHLPHLRGASKAPRLRHREVDCAQGYRGEQKSQRHHAHPGRARDPAGCRARNTRVHVPRAGTWRAGGRPDGHLQPRYGALRDAGRRPRVPRQELDRERARHPRIRAPCPAGVGSEFGRFRWCAGVWRRNRPGAFSPRPTSPSPSGEPRLRAPEGLGRLFPEPRSPGSVALRRSAPCLRWWRSWL